MAKLYENVVIRALTRQMGRQLTGQFSKKQEVVTGTPISQTQVLVGATRYPLRNSVGATITPGQPMKFRNIGRLAAAEYAPTEDTGN
jgi:hypothetical protein